MTIRSLRCAVTASLLAAGCSNLPGLWSGKGAGGDADLVGGMSVRRVSTPSDVVRIRPDYQIVISADEEQLSCTHCTVKWEVRVTARPLPSAPPPAQKPVEPANPVSVAPPARTVLETVQLDETHFESGVAHLSKKAMVALDHAFVEIKKLGLNKLSILGHTDSTGTRKLNQSLSERRVEAVFAYLKAKGLAVTEVERSGFADSAPVADNSIAEGRAQNRRTEILATVSKSAQ
ncbi:MAG: OmpA family protein [Rhodocyclaceae bacterium]|nr:MAG: OmpA family protein [Rhodocyclaceae bacterium]